MRKIIVEGLGHAWSGGDERHSFNDAAGPDASRLIWDFVSMFHRDYNSWQFETAPAVSRLPRPEQDKRRDNPRAVFS